MATAFGRWPLMAEAQIQSQASPGEICGGQSGTGTGFPPNTSVFTGASVPSSGFNKSLEDGTDMLPRNVGTQLSVYTV
jgi:hypothetical protein